jgi:hypothetical protein
VAQSQRARRRWWPGWGLVGIVLVHLGDWGHAEAPILPPLRDYQDVGLPADAATALRLAGEVVLEPAGIGIGIGVGLSWVGLAFLVPFFVGLFRLLAAGASAPRTLPLVALAGGLVTVGGLFVGYAVIWTLLESVSDGDPDLVVESLFALQAGLAYVPWTWLGIVTAAVALSGFRHRSVTWWLAIPSAVFTVIFLLAALWQPFISPFVATIWLLLAVATLIGRAETESLSATDAGGGTSDAEDARVG